MIKNLIIKVLSAGTCATLVYHAIQALRKQMIVHQANHIRDMKMRYGDEFIISADKQNILDEADAYLKNHAGYRYLSRMRTEQFFQDQLKHLIKDKQAKISAISPEEQQKIKQLQSEIEQLNKAYAAIQPKVVRTFQDFKDNDD